MGWQVADDIEFYEQAEIHQAQLRPHWWVMWSPSRCCYTAFYCGPATVPPVDVPPGRNVIAELRAAEARGVRSHRGFPPRNRPR